jgi:hypothetical protein
VLSEVEKICKDNLDSNVMLDSNKYKLSFDRATIFSNDVYIKENFESNGSEIMAERKYGKTDYYGKYENVKRKKRCFYRVVVRIKKTGV